MMEITALSKQNKRKALEDELRSSLIKYMTEELGFPSSCILKEKSLTSLSCLLPHLQSKLPLRRVDIAITTPCSSQGLRLLMIVECKMDAQFESALAQVQGYNHHLSCPFVWIASEKRSCILSWKQNDEGGEYLPFERVPSYKNLISIFKSLGDA